MRILIIVIAALLGRAVLAADGASYLDLNLQQSRYLGEVQNSNQESNYNFLSGNLELEGKTQVFLSN